MKGAFLTTDQLIRQEAMKMAVQVSIVLKTVLKSEDIRSIAQKFYEFMRGDGSDER